MRPIYRCRKRFLWFSTAILLLFPTAAYSSEYRTGWDRLKERQISASVDITCSAPWHESIAFSARSTGDGEFRVKHRDDQKTVFCANADYIFAVEPNRLTDGWVLDFVRPRKEAESLLDQRIRTLQLTPISMYQLTLPEVWSSPTFEVVSIDTKQNHVVNFVCDVEIPNATFELIGGTVTLDTDNDWAILQYEARYKEDGEISVFIGDRSYDKKNRIVAAWHGVKDGQKESYEFQYIDEFISPAAVRLAAFGLPEPQFLTASSSNPIKLTLIVGLALIAFGIWLRRRAAS